MTWELESHAPSSEKGIGWIACVESRENRKEGRLEGQGEHSTQERLTQTMMSWVRSLCHAPGSELARSVPNDRASMLLLPTSISECVSVVGDRLGRENARKGE